ncbi:neuropeptide-like protein 28 [Drosophila mojavensis]|uniref:Neuropeptide-like protein 31 n=1 Tax=Drosophila mojavensis TaxID=7230 RepID=B4KMM8_DROMO|nr:neuropeptide-like protein 28 [Drosophila mojavensis]EDW08770.2 uncharacterized protein Dmoj_GI20136 [Drosophila mojavensis]
MAKFLIGFLFLTVLIMCAQAAPSESVAIADASAEVDDLSTADSIGVGYYAPSYYRPYYGGYGGYKYGGYSGYGYGGYRGYGSYYRRPIYPVWG